jgi:hypothetical protein
VASLGGIYRVIAAFFENAQTCCSYSCLRHDILSLRFCALVRNYTNAGVCGGTMVQMVNAAGMFV